MTARSTLEPDDDDADDAPAARVKGHDTRSLGPSDSSDSGSDLARPGTDRPGRRTCRAGGWLGDRPEGPWCVRQVAEHRRPRGGRALHADPLRGRTPGGTHRLDRMGHPAPSPRALRGPPVERGARARHGVAHRRRGAGGTELADRVEVGPRRPRSARHLRLTPARSNAVQTPQTDRPAYGDPSRGTRVALWWAHGPYAADFCRVAHRFRGATPCVPPANRYTGCVSHTASTCDVNDRARGGLSCQRTNDVRPAEQVSPVWRFIA